MIDSNSGQWIFGLHRNRKFLPQLNTYQLFKKDTESRDQLLRQILQVDKIAQCAMS